MADFSGGGGGTSEAALASVLGALDDAVAAGAVTTEDTVMQYVKQIVTAIIEIDTNVDTVNTDLGNGTDGLGALKTLLDAIPTTAMRGTNSAALASVLGALNDAGATGAVTTTDTVMQYIKQIVSAIIVIDTNVDDIETLVNTINGLVDSAETTATFVYDDGTGSEQTIVEDTTTTRRKISVEFDLDAMTVNGTIRLYRKIDASTYRKWSETTFVAAGAEQAFDFQFTTNQAWKLTYQEVSNEGADRNIPYNVITEVIQ